MRITRAQGLGILAVVALLTAGAVAVLAAAGPWLPQVMLIERSPFEVFPPRWDLTVYPGGIEHEFLTDEELGELVGYYCRGIRREAAAADE